MGISLSALCTQAWLTHAAYSLHVPHPLHAPSVVTLERALRLVVRTLPVLIALIRLRHVLQRQGRWRAASGRR